jgi:hypothetical protein
MTGNGNVGGDQNQQQSGPEAAVVQKIIGNQANGSHEKDIGGSSQSLGAGSPEVSVAGESHGNSHEQPRKRAKRIVRSMPGSSCLRCKVKKTKCEPSDTKERICKRYVNRISTKKQVALLEFDLGLTTLKMRIWKS